MSSAAESVEAQASLNSPTYLALDAVRNGMAGLFGSPPGTSAACFSAGVHGFLYCTESQEHLLFCLCGNVHPSNVG